MHPSLPGQPLLPSITLQGWCEFRHTEGVFTSTYSRNGCVHLYSTPRSCFVASDIYWQRPEKTKINPGFNSNHFILDQVFFPLLYRCRLCLNNWISSAARSQSASNLRQEPSIQVNTAGSALALLHWSAEQTQSITHILFKSTRNFWFVLSNMHGIK